MKIAIIGYGKMGKEIEAIALGRGHTISNTYSSNSPFNEQSEIDADVAIEFSTPGLATKHISLCFGSSTTCGRWNNGMARAFD